MITTEELIKVALLPKPITVEIKGIAEKCCELLGKAYKGKEGGKVCIYNHFSNTFDELPGDAIIQSSYPVLVFSAKEAKTHTFFTLSNMPFSVEGENDPDFWKFTFDQRFGEPVEPTYTLVEQNSFNYLDFKNDPLYAEAIAHYIVDNTYAKNLISYAKYSLFENTYFISKNLLEFKVFNPHLLKNNARRLGYTVDDYNKFIRGCNLTRLKSLVGCAVEEKRFGISAINLGRIENKTSRIEDDIALLCTDQPLDRAPRHITLGDMVKIEISFLIHQPADRNIHRLGKMNYSDELDHLTLQWLSCAYIYDSFLIGCKPVKNLKASTVFAMIQLNHFRYENTPHTQMPDLKDYTVRVRLEEESRDINLLDFLNCLDECIAVEKPRSSEIDYHYCEAIYQKALDKSQPKIDLVDLFFL